MNDENAAWFVQKLPLLGLLIALPCWGLAYLLLNEYAFVLGGILLAVGLFVYVLSNGAKTVYIAKNREQAIEHELCFRRLYRKPNPPETTTEVGREIRYGAFLTAALLVMAIAPFVTVTPA
ncbi:hypothetical protein [Halorussus halophilus]|uniref:hypothetical protein n=1 Tax=Halorussus halophilus TaxID=2650975 RepID=UPI0013010896|nr:hypothetical protein [Halorussus halophilus]